MDCSNLKDDREKLGLFELEGEFTEIYTPYDMCEKFGIDNSNGICDGYGHLTSCKWIVQEAKEKKHITKGLRQLESTLQKMRVRGIRVDYAVLVIEKNGERSKYEIYEHRLYSVSGKMRRRANQKPISIYGIPLIVIKIDEIANWKEKRGDPRWLFS